MVMRLAENLDVPLRDRNPLLIAAGYAPTYQATDFGAPEMQPVRDAVERILSAHEPYPAILVDRSWELVGANSAAAVLVEGVAPDLLAPSCNVLRASLHPHGLAPRIINIAQWSAHIIDNLRRQIAVTGDDGLRELERELVGYAADMGVAVPPSGEVPRSIAMPMRLRTDAGDRWVEGTVFEPNSPRLVSVRGVDVEAPLGGTMIIIANTDRPGVIGEVGTILGRHGVNIASFALGRSELGAIGVVNVDEEAGAPRILDGAVEELRKVPAIREAWVIRLASTLG